ncbi:hypothetical protein BKH36_08760 [Actinomyces naeslundii]|uniref:hypothetical protein n=1 Tax=Actinomyces naeslundii TaxID=1655 RepID=UPI00096EB352|nr:hypothetical protein [Actinomyces naeslundii]OMG26202.1 hypothetical protein BKH36_08760 [Actinomyces naeslundii]
MAVKKAVRRRASGLVGLAGAVVLASSLSMPLMAPVAAEPAAGNTFDTVAEMAQVSGASGTLTTLGDEAPGDGGGLTYTVESKIPEGALGAVSVMLADGQWAVPQGLPVAPTVASDGAAANDVVARVQSFADAGGSLVSDASRPTPLSGANVHASGPAPYAITSSALVGMVLSGWDYSHTTYVADQNTQVGYRAEIGQDLGGSWKPDDLAGWFNGQGLLWLNSNGALSAGDIVFFSKPLPDEQGGSGSAPAQSTVFGNVYDVGIYMGDGKIARGSSGGVQVQALDAQAAAEVSMVARPQWSAPAGGAAAPDQQKDSGGAGAGATASPQATSSASPQAKPQPTPASGAPSANGGSVPDGGSGSGSQSSGEAGKDDHNEVVVGASGSQSSKGRTSAAERSSAKNVRERWLPVTGVAIGVLSMAAILLSGGLIVLRLRRG